MRIGCGLEPLAVLTHARKRRSNQLRYEGAWQKAVNFKSIF